MNRLQGVLAAGGFAVTAEIGPPKGADPTRLRRYAERLRECTDAQNLTDNQTAIVRLSSLAACVHVLAAGGEPVLQVTCRDRNRIAIQSDLLGAYSLGVQNVLCLSGDHQSFGNHPTAKNVYDIDSIQLLGMVRRMRDEGCFLCGEEMKAPPRFFIGAAANPFADPLEFRAKRLAKKIAAGADFIQTQAVFDLERFRTWMAMVRDIGLDEQTAILAGVIPPKSARALRFMAQVPGMAVPKELLRRMESASDQQEEGKRICSELMEELRSVPGVRGLHIMAVMWEDVVPELVERAGLLPRPWQAASFSGRETG
ncbi:MAG TPA: methylenetetrahydrofolate reductase [Firmicutes bacterium]|jgi:methylenetetrahydrofolate reductase (NADPH)|nr:methylenetetrahydrofolate reductase [Bacillota bacterium]